MARKIHLLFALCFLVAVCRSQQVLPLYPGPVPNSKQVTNQETVTPNEVVGPLVQQVSEPTLEVFLPPQNTASGTAGRLHRQANFATSGNRLPTRAVRHHPDLDVLDAIWNVMTDHILHDRTMTIAIIMCVLHTYY